MVPSSKHSWAIVAPVAGGVADRQQDRHTVAAAAKASAPQGYQSTGLSRCWRRYGEVSPARRFTRAGYAPTVVTAVHRTTSPVVAGNQSLSRATQAFATADEW